MEDSDLFGDVVVNGSQSFNSMIELQRTSLRGNLKINGTLQAGAQLKLIDSDLFDGMLKIDGDINTSASVLLQNANFVALTDKKSLWIIGTNLF